jgi:hypothetical protein
VTRCDQVVVAPVLRIMDFDDYCKKDPAFITMSVYMINLLRTKDANSLFHSILYGNLRNKPAFLPGAPGCLDFVSRMGPRVAICFNGGMAEAKEILAAYDKFASCKNGSNGGDSSKKNSTDCPKNESSNDGKQVNYLPKFISFLLGCIRDFKRH